MKWTYTDSTKRNLNHPSLWKTSDNCAAWLILDVFLVDSRIFIFSNLVKVLFWIVYYWLIFYCAGSLLLPRLFSSCSEQGLLPTCGARASHWGGFSCCRAQTLEQRGFRIVTLALEHRLSGVVHGLSCPVACGVFLDQGLNLCLLLWQADSWLLSYQGSPGFVLNMH